MSITHLPSRILRMIALRIFRKKSTILSSAIPPDAGDEPPALPKSAKLAGTPLWLLQSERMNPGALLSDRLRHQPSESED